MTGIDQFISLVSFNAEGLAPVVVQEVTSKDVLMLAWMNADALRMSLETARGTYFSRSRSRLWIKGEESGHIQHVVDIRLDCDSDALVMMVRQHGPACHTGNPSCFFNVVVVENE